VKVACAKNEETPRKNQNTIRQNISEKTEGFTGIKAELTTPGEILAQVAFC
jgi:hypothetical protein